MTSSDYCTTKIDYDSIKQITLYHNFQVQILTDPLRHMSFLDLSLETMYEVCIRRSAIRSMMPSGQGPSAMQKESPFVCMIWIHLNQYLFILDIGQSYLSFDTLILHCVHYATFDPHYTPHSSTFSLPLWHILCPFSSNLRSFWAQFTPFLVIATFQLQGCTLWCWSKRSQFDTKQSNINHYNKIA